MPEHKHSKALRTRYVNLLSKEIEDGSVLLQLDLKVIDLSMRQKQKLKCL